MTDRHMTDEVELSVLATWTHVLNILQGSDWSDEDVLAAFSDDSEPRRLAALAMKYTYDRIENKDHGYGEDGVRATILAARRWKDNTLYLSPADVCTMADHFTARWDDFDQVLDDHLLEYYNDFPLRLVTEEGKRELTSAIRGDGEIWIDETNAPVNRNPLPGAWCFANPKYAHH